MSHLKRFSQFLNDYRICYKGWSIDSVDIIEEYLYFLNNLSKRNKRTVSVVLHTGDISFDVASVTFLAIYELLLNNHDDYDDQYIQPGSLVYIEGETQIKGKNIDLYTYKGIEKIENSDYLVLEKSSKDHYVRKLPRRRWENTIKPYLNNGERALTGSGNLKSKTEKRYKNISSLMGIPFMDVPRILNNSAIIVATKKLADEIVNNVSIENKFSKEVFSFSDLFTASYYGEKEEVPYRGNVEKSDPTIKFTSKLSVARDLIYNPSSNTPVGVFVLERDGVNQSTSELEELMNRRSLRFFSSSYFLDSEQGYSIIRAHDEIDVFACTKDYVFEHDSFTRPELQNAYEKNFNSRVEIIKKQRVIPVVLGSELTLDEYRAIKKSLKIIKNNGFTNDNSEEFVIQAGALLNLFTTAPFSLQDFEKYLAANAVTASILSITARFNLLTNYAEAWNGLKKEKAIFIIDTLMKLYKEFRFVSPKKTILYGKMISANAGKIAVVIPKAYYESIIKYQWPSLNYNNISFFTPNTFDNTAIYNKILVLGNYHGSRFNQFRCRSAISIEVLIYEFEQKIFNSRLFLANRDEQILNKRIGMESYTDNKNELSMIPDDDISDLENYDALLFERSEKISIDALKAQAQSSGKGIGQMINVIGSGCFSDGEVIWFSKHYKATIFDENTGVVSLVPVEEIRPGHTLIFTKRNTLTKDIVDEILEKLIDEKIVNKTIAESYKKVQKWKTALRSYMALNEITYEELGIRLGGEGEPRHFATVRSWIHPFSHIVGPMDIESYRQISLLTQDKEMLEDPEAFRLATKVVRDERRLILKMISQAIIKQLGGAAQNEDSIFRAVYENIDGLSLQKQIESVSIFDHEEEAPISIVNRPISI